MKIKKYIIYILTSIICLCASSCDEDPILFSQSDSAPYVISKPVCYVSPKEGYYTAAGVEFYYTNTSDKTVTKLYVSFMVYDAETKRSPFIGSNTIKVTHNGTVAPGEKILFITSLDPYTHIAPSKPYIIDFFYISRIEYSDGSAWEDKYGVYHTGSG